MYTEHGDPRLHRACAEIYLQGLHRDVHCTMYIIFTTLFKVYQGSILCINFQVYATAQTLYYTAFILAGSVGKPPLEC